jgi:hypothetical protein
LTNQDLFLLGQLGKPHALNGYLYLNHEIFFREFDLTGLNVSIKDSKYEIENFKTHLKNRYLVKFKNLDSISSIEIFRGEKVYITSQQISNFISSNLPWPGFFIGTNLNDQYYIKNYFYAGELIYLTLVSKKEFTIPYNESFFKYQNDNLHIINLDLFQ